MNTVKITEEKFINLAMSAVKDESVESSSMTFLRSSEGLLIQSASGEYFLIER